MKRLLGFCAFLLLQSPALAQVKTEKYVERCWVQGTPSMCFVTDYRTPDGGLDARLIESSNPAYSYYSYYEKGQGFITWDSVSKRRYKFPYQPAGQLSSRVSPHLVIRNVSWD